MSPGAKPMIVGCDHRRPGPGPTVSAGFARGLLELAVAKGADRRRLLDQAGLTGEALEDQPGQLCVPKLRPSRAHSSMAKRINSRHFSLPI